LPMQSATPFMMTKCETSYQSLEKMNDIVGLQNATW
jgi:hypothetical protein